MSVTPDEGVFLEIVETGSVIGVETDESTSLELLVEEVVNVVDLPIAEFLEFDDGRGPTGAQGPAGAPGGAVFSYHQTPASATWPITHNLGRYINPVVRLDSDPQTPVWTDVTLIDENHVTLTFDQPESGWAHF